MLKIFLLLGFFAHLLCAVTDCLFTYTPHGRLNLQYLKEPQKMAQLFEDMSLKRIVWGMILGLFALTILVFCYFALCQWVSQFSLLCKLLMLIGVVVFSMSGVVHHVFVGVIEWFYVKLNRTEEVLNCVVEFFKSTFITMILCYVGWTLFSVAFFVLVICKSTTLPAWACVFNILPIMLVLLPTKLPAKGNIAGSIMFLGLFFVI